MRERAFQLRSSSSRAVWEARWRPFDFPEVLNLVDRGDGVVAVLCKHDARTDQWVDVLREYGLVLEPVALTTEAKEAA